MNRKELSLIEKKPTNPVTLHGITIPCDIIFLLLKHLKFMEVRYFASTSKRITDIVMNFFLSEKIISIDYPVTDQSNSNDDDENESEGTSEDEVDNDNFREEIKYSYLEINKILSAKVSHKERIDELNNTADWDLVCYVFSALLISVPTFIAEAILGYDESYRPYSLAMGGALWIAYNFFALKKENKIDSERDSEKEILKKLPSITFNKY